MRLLRIDGLGELSLADHLDYMTYPYAILSHTWGRDQDEFTFHDLQTESSKSKDGYTKIRFCGEQARKHKLEYFWVDTCCIDQSNNNELSEAINSMFRWYRHADRCYVYLRDVSVCNDDSRDTQLSWEPAFRRSRWFTRGWTLQELIAPVSVEFFSREWIRLGDKGSLEDQIHEITGIPISALRGTPLPHFSIDERMRWAAKRETKKKEDKAYCLLGMFNVVMPLIYGEEDHAFIRLNRKIHKSAMEERRRHQQLVGGSDQIGHDLAWELDLDPICSAGNVHWAVDRSVNTLFTGREDTLDDLETIVRAAVYGDPQVTQCRIVISGMGGQGKSEICLQLAQRTRSIFWGVFWVDVSTSSLARSGFLNIADRLKIPASTWEDGRQGLANLQQPWLLVLDNADDPSIDYRDFFPPSSSGVVLLTSRNDDCQLYATAKFIQLAELPVDEAQHLVLKAAKTTDRQRPIVEGDARTVAILLHSHPLALIQAGAYVSRGHCTLAKYPQVYHRQRKRLLAFQQSQARSRYGDVYATFQASVEILEASDTESAQDALQLLPLLSVGGPSRLPLRLFEAAWNGARRISADSSHGSGLELSPWHLTQMPALVQRNADSWDSYRLVEAVHMLKALALVSTDIQDEQMSVSMHPLLHTWARDRQDEQKQHATWVSAGCIFALSCSDEELWRVYARQLQPHLQILVAWDMRCIFGSGSHITIASILKTCGMQLNSMRDDKSLFVLLEQLCAHLGLSKSVIEEQWIPLYHLIGLNLKNYGKVKDAVTVLEKLVQIHEKLVEDHPSRLESQHELACAYQANGQVDKAVTLLEHVVRIRETLAEDHPSRLESQHELACAYQTNGQVDKAVTLLEHVVQTREKLAEDHPSRLESQHELASAYEANGQVDKAVTLLEHVVRTQEKLAEDHPSRLASQHLLACVYQANGQIDKAVTLLEHVVQIEEKLAEDHPSRLASQHNLACAYQANGQIDKAVTLLEHVVRIEEKLAEDHPSRAVSQHALATLLWHIQQYSAALHLMRNVVKIHQRNLQEHHPSRELSEAWLRHFEEHIAKYNKV